MPQLQTQPQMQLLQLQTFGGFVHTSNTVDHMQLFVPGMIVINASSAPI